MGTCQLLQGSYLLRRGCFSCVKLHRHGAWRCSLLAWLSWVGSVPSSVVMPQVHAVILDLPAQLCANRAAGRVDHEGGLDGPGAKSAVYRLATQLAKAGRPQASEGLSSIMVRSPELPFTFLAS